MHEQLKTIWGLIINGRHCKIDVVVLPGFIVSSVVVVVFFVVSVISCFK